MKNTKTEFRFFTITEWKKEEKYLREQHKNGWKFVSVNLIGLYHFKKCTPKDVIYQLDYNTDSVTQKDEYIQMFKDCGWEYIQNFCGYSYFRKAESDMDGNMEEIFCDDDSRLEMMKRVFQRRMTPLLAIFFLIIIPQIFLQSHIDSPANHVLTIIFIIMFILYLVLFLAFGIQFWKYYKSINKKM